MTLLRTSLCFPQKHVCGSALEVLFWQLAPLRGAPSTLLPPRRFGLVACGTRRDGLVGPQQPKSLLQQHCKEHLLVGPKGAM